MLKPVVAAVILAAGGSNRFGEPKQLLPWHGRPLIAHIADKLAGVFTINSQLEAINN